jgi:hypothetical protein
VNVQLDIMNQYMEKSLVTHVTGDVPLVQEPLKIVTLVSLEELIHQLVFVQKELPIVVPPQLSLNVKIAHTNV